MRVLVIHAHPVAESFNGALHRLVVERLTAKGHEVDDCDLYGEGFNPLLTREERIGYHDIGDNLAPVADYVERVRSAEALVMCYPVWNFGYPAMLKGFFDRVFLPGVSFTMADGKVKPCLHNIAKVAAVTSYGGTWLRATLVGNPPRKSVMRVLRAIVKPAAPFTYLAHYDMNRSTPETREAFMKKVAAAMDSF
ncbi:MAG: NAD(P)H-dependent oxidoreductase [Salaquimonas sp.]|jgi:putative NADPH-quinone reductase|nr:NAD(P)H-dependent oxidoreductase [Salaquimonas sp.]